LLRAAFTLIELLVVIAMIAIIVVMDRNAEPADAPNPALSLWFHSGHHWRGAGDPFC
jgi:prepilin-type N-terminal cleavage/methylation domain-containing protein